MSVVNCFSEVYTFSTFVKFDVTKQCCKVYHTADQTEQGAASVTLTAYARQIARDRLLIDPICLAKERILYGP